MPKVALYDMSGKEIDKINLKDSIFGIEPNTAVLHDAVVMQQASLRQGTHKVKNRSEVSGGGRKPWRQKGTGRARVGSTRSPIWVGGGTVFGPTPRSYAYKLPKKVRRLALKSALSSKVIENEIIVLNELNFAEVKTKNMVNLLDKLNVKTKVLIVDKDYNDNAILSLRNLPGVKFVTAEGINVLDLLYHDKLIITKEAVERIEEVLV
jgi:large subunit ribosomal protein L4